MRPRGILETILYATDLEAAKRFYNDVLGMEPFAGTPGRSLFYRFDNHVLLLFNPEFTKDQPTSPGQPPRHGAFGPGHICFRATKSEIDDWRRRLEAAGVEIEADFEWPGNRGRSIYFRDPADNSLEFAEPGIWGLAE